jgi:hypothetical protein
MKPGRIPCEVPFCRRTAPAARYEPETRIICGKCWRLGDARPRRVFSRAERKYKRTGNPRYQRIANRCWERVLKQAIERSAGVSA